MGAIFGKRIPVHKVTTEMLRSHKTCNFSKNQLLTPRMCSLVLKKTPDRTLKCREREVTALKDFLDSQHNFVDKVTFPLPRKARLTWKYFFVLREKISVPQTCYFFKLSYDQTSHHTGYQSYQMKDLGIIFLLIPRILL